MPVQCLVTMDLQSVSKLTFITVKSRADTLVAIQKIKSLEVLLLETCHQSRRVSIHRFKNFDFSKVSKINLKALIDSWSIGFYEARQSHHWFYKVRLPLGCN